MLHGFWQNLLENGEVALVAPPEFDSSERASLLSMLNHYYTIDSLSIAGPNIPFDPELAILMSQWVALACWFSVSFDEPPEVVEKNLKLSIEATKSEQIATVDFLLRYIVTLAKRVQILQKDDIFTRILLGTLRQWPLTGVLCESIDPPLRDLEFSHHTGLQLRYAERLADYWKIDWLPPSGRTRELIELVFSQRNLYYRLPTPQGIS